MGFSVSYMKRNENNAKLIMSHSNHNNYQKLMGFRLKNNKQGGN